MPDSNESLTLDLQPSSSSTKASNVYTSTPFKFIVEGNVFYLHAALVSRHSRPLDRMMNGDMSEAQKGYAVLEDVDEGTFGRFAEWAYEGYYTPGQVIDRSLDSPSPGESAIEDGGSVRPIVSPPDISQLEEALPIVDVEPPITIERRSYAPVSRTHTGHKKRYKEYHRHIRSPEESSSATGSSRIQLKESFIHRKATVRRDSISVPPPHPNQGPEEDYTDVFLSHAQLYVFAEKYDIKTLRKLALENLQNILAIFTLYEERTGDIITLLRYSYANTSESIWAIEDLRTLLTHYVGYEMDTLMKDEDFRDLMISDGGALLGDFMKMVMERIS
ncbi:MAG: hypothetical protein Q9172_002541 [Xanthocarpia lactea]